MKSYCLGFNFVHGRKGVLLIEKTRPEWQKGYWNGLGGKIDRYENSHEAMVREFSEESGCITDILEWSCIGKVSYTDSINIVVEPHDLYIFRRDIDITSYNPYCDEGKLYIHDTELLPRMLPLNQALLLLCLQNETLSAGIESVRK